MKNLFRKIFFPRTTLVDTQNFVLSALPRKVHQWAETFLLKIRQGWSKLSFWNYFYFSPKWSFGKVGCSFGNPAIRPLVPRNKSDIFRWKFGNDKNLGLWQLKFFFETFLRDVEFSFYNFAEFFLPKLHKFLLKVRKWQKNIVSSKKTFFPSHISFGHVEWCFSCFSKKIQPEVI